jgi:hypothetical protein
MAVELIKVSQGKAALVDNLPNFETVQCTRCTQTYEFRYSAGEAYRLKDWLRKANVAVDRSHDGGHWANSLAVPW